MKTSLTPYFSRLAHKIHPQLGKLYDWKPSYWNYAFVGGLGVILNWTLFLSLRSWFGDLAWWIGTILAWNFNYALSKVWVFKEVK